MAEKFLGSEFEIHGGGNDLRFPHHENELAQSRSLGHAFARIWMHNGMLELDAAKMSKSLGNVVSLRNVLDVWGREALLVFHLTGAWSKPVDFDDEVMQQAAARADRLRDVFRSAHQAAPDGSWERFAAALDEDFNTPAALAVMHEWRDHDLLRRALDVFGLGSLADADEVPRDASGACGAATGGPGGEGLRGGRSAARRARTSGLGGSRRARRYRLVRIR